jgi:hypothetical protein
MCDVAETCEGTSIACPFDGGITTTPVCREAGAICDLAEHCDGTGPVCPADTGGGSTAVCRPATGVCDLAEFCDGTAGACPTDAFATPATSCRESSGICDAAEVCSGTGASCPVDALASSVTTCRASSGTCDVAERCNGATTACPTDSFVPDETPCDDAAFCNGADFCSGGSCAIHAGNPCSNLCAFTCHESTDTCLDARFTPCLDDNDPCTDDVCDGSGQCGIFNTAPCDDGESCTADDRCENGVCTGRGLPLECDDRNPCTIDACDPETGCSHTDRPAVAVSGENCEVAGRSRIKIDDDGDQDSLGFQFGPQWIDADYAALGSPDSSTLYGLCIYDSSGFVPRLVASYVVEPSAELWRGREPKSWTYRDRDGTSAGVTKLLLKPGPRGRIKLAAEGPNLVLPGPVGATYFDADTYVEFDLVSSTGRCWVATYGIDRTKRNDTGGFSGSFTFGD